MISSLPVYVVDGDPEVRRTLVDLLTLNGIAAEEFGSGTATLQAAQGPHRPGLALIEHRLPDTTGIELAIGLRSLDPDLSVLLLTGRPSMESAIASVGVADAYLTKPIEPGGLLRSVRAGLERTRRRRSNRDLLSRLQDMNSALETTVVAQTQDLRDAHRLALTVRAERKQETHAMDTAVASSQFKSQFLANTSHEIRTPMNGVLGMVHLLLDTELTSDQHRYVGILRDSAHDLLAIIEPMLDYSAMEAGKLELVGDVFELPALLDSVINSMASRAKGKSLPVTLVLAADVPRWVRGDSVRLRQIVTNLVDNAIKFTATGHIDVSATVVGVDRVAFEVTDTGIGIEPTAGPSLFDPFTQGDSSSTRRFGGTGIGLAICRQLVELMNGDLSYSSEIGHGSTFRFDITLSRAGDDSIQIGRSASLPSTAIPVATPGIPPGIRALVVDDVAVNQIVAAAMLKNLGYQIDISSDGAYALEAVQSIEYDVILMDCLMPVMDGYEATARIRSLEGSERHTYIIAVTTASSPQDRRKCLAAGMDDFLAKPIDPVALKEALNRSREKV